MGDKSYLYKRVEQFVTDIIEENKSKTNYKLPSENELMEQLSVSRITVKNALTNLEKQGKIYKMQGKGSFIKQPSSQIFSIDATSRGDKRKMVAFLVPTLKSRFINGIINALDEALTEQGYTLLICKTFFSQNREEAMLRELYRLDVGGFIVFPVDGEVYSDELLKLVLEKFPLVFIDRTLSGLNVSVISSNHYAAAYDATNLLLEKNCRKIGYISNQSVTTSSIGQRLQGYEQALLDCGLSPDPKLNFSFFSKIELEQELDLNAEVEDYLNTNTGIDALLIADYEVGLKLLNANQRKKILDFDRIPVVFFDNELKDFMDILPVKPYIVKQNTAAIGQTAAKYLLDMIRQTDTGKKNTLIDTIIIKPY